MLMGLLTGLSIGLSARYQRIKNFPSDLPPTPVLKLSHGAVPAHGSPLPCRGSPMWYTGVVPALTAPSFPETIPAGALDALPWLTVLSGAVLGLIGTGPDIFSGSDLLRSLLKRSKLSSVDLSQITATSLSICPSPSGSLGLRYHVKNTRAAWQLFFTARTWAKPHRFDSSVTLLLRRVVQSKTQWHSNVLKLLKLLQKSSQASKTFFQLLQIKRLQLKLTNNHKTPTK